VGSLKEGVVVFDTVYNPEKTMLLREAAERGAKTVSGMTMFVGQAEAQFRLFTGMDPPPNLMLSLVREELSPGRNMLRQARQQQQQTAAAGGDSPSAAPEAKTSQEQDP